jgi:chromosome partitioning protein
VKIKESHEQAKPMIELDAKHKVSLEFVALYATLTQAKNVAKARTKRMA